MVPQQQVFVVEKWGKYSGQLEAGLHFRPPVMYRVAYAPSLKETAMHVEPQDAITHAPPFPQPPQRAPARKADDGLRVGPGGTTSRSRSTAWST